MPSNTQITNKSGLGGTTAIVEVTSGTVADAVVALAATHTIAGVQGNYLAVQGTGEIDVNGVEVIVTFA